MSLCRFQSAPTGGQLLATGVGELHPNRPAPTPGAPANQGNTAEGQGAAQKPRFAATHLSLGAGLILRRKDVSWKSPSEQRAACNVFRHTHNNHKKSPDSPCSPPKDFLSARWPWGPLLLPASRRSRVGCARAGPGSFSGRLWVPAAGGAGCGVSGHPEPTCARKGALCLPRLPACRRLAFLRFYSTNCVRALMSQPELSESAVLPLPLPGLVPRVPRGPRTTEPSDLGAHAPAAPSFLPPVSRTPPRPPPQLRVCALSLWDTPPAGHSRPSWRGAGPQALSQTAGKFPGT